MQTILASTPTHYTSVYSCLSLFSAGWILIGCQVSVIVKVIPSIPFLRVVIIIVLVLFFRIYSYFKTVLLDAEMCICVLGFIRDH